MIFRPAATEDLDDIMRVAAEGREYLESQGIDQWKNGYPQRFFFEEDIAAKGCYVGVEEGEVVAIGTILLEPDPNYSRIEDGRWLTPDDAKYAVIHRGAVAAKARGKGAFKQMMAFFEEEARARGAVSVRADTHEDNKIMQNALIKLGFTHCGRVYIEYREDYKAHWVAFEKLL